MWHAPRHLTRLLARQQRRLLNAADVALTAERVGFRVGQVDWAELRLREQAAWMQATDVVVGVYGVGLIKIIFARPGAAVVELIPYCFSNASDFWELSRTLRVRHYSWRNPDPARSACGAGVANCRSNTPRVSAPTRLESMPVRRGRAPPAAPASPTAGRFRSSVAKPYTLNPRPLRRRRRQLQVGVACACLSVASVTLELEHRQGSLTRQRRRAAQGARVRVRPAGGGAQNGRRRRRPAHAGHRRRPRRDARTARRRPCLCHARARAHGGRTWRLASASREPPAVCVRVLCRRAEPRGWMRACHLGLRELSRCAHVCNVGFRQVSLLTACIHVVILL